MSFDPNLRATDEDTLHSFFKRTYSILKFLGISGGLAMYHNDRIPSKFNDRDDMETGPHMHCLGDASIDPEKVLCVYEQTGILVKGMGRPDDLPGHLAYVLSHLGVPREVIPGWIQTEVEGPFNPALDGIMQTRLHTIRWFGTWCRLKGHLEDGRFCAICGHSVPLEDWGRVIWLPMTNDPPDDEWIDGSEMDWVIRHGHGYGE